MWKRTKRLINSYLDNLIEKVERPQEEVQAAGAVKTSQLGRHAAETLATVKLFEKQSAELEVKIIGLERRLATVTSETQRMILQSELDRSRAELLDLQQRLVEAHGAAAQARATREAHPGQVHETVNNATLAAMGERASSMSAPTRQDDPAWIMDEMRAKIEQRGQLSTAARIAQADAELTDSGKVVDDLLTQYKQDVSPAPPAPPKAVNPPAAPNPDPSKDEPTSGGKTLGSAGEIKSLD